MHNFCLVTVMIKGRLLSSTTTVKHFQAENCEFSELHLSYRFLARIS